MGHVVRWRRMGKRLKTNLLTRMISGRPVYVAVVRATLYP
jgi:hypothetical protein